ncbi:MAG: patatin-like phospholipase family protein [Micropepsaceae bacterium]
MEADAASRYDFNNNLPRRNNSQRVFVVLAFSGGGTRAAAFSYGVLKGLRNTDIQIDGRHRRLLDEVDVISSVSGGSFTAAYYGLFGNRIFDDYEHKFLKRDVSGDMIARLLDPTALASLTSSHYNRGDLAASWLADNLFEHKTFADMSHEPRPFVIINASDLNTGLTFSFVQQQFDFLCSNLKPYPVANAVMASAAMPVIFAPVAVRNFDTNCRERNESWVPAVLKRRDLFTREYQVARGLSRYFDPRTLPIVRLVDGGVTDNLGVRGSMMSPVAHYGNVADMAGAFSHEALDKVTDVLVVVANAQIYGDYDWSRRGSDPGITEMLYSSFDSAVDILSTETVSLAKSGFQMWADQINARRKPGTKKVLVNFATLTFDGISDSKTRARFNAIPTTLALPARDVDDLQKLAEDLLSQSDEYQRFVESLR